MQYDVHGFTGIQHQGQLIAGDAGQIGGGSIVPAGLKGGGGFVKQDQPCTLWTCHGDAAFAEIPQRPGPCHIRRGRTWHGTALAGAVEMIHIIWLNVTLWDPS